MPRQPTFKELSADRLNEDPVLSAKAELAAKLVRFLGTAQSVEEYVSPSGYRFKKVTHREEVQAIAVNQ